MYICLAAYACESVGQTVTLGFKCGEKCVPLAWESKPALKTRASGCAMYYMYARCIAKPYHLPQHLGRALTYYHDPHHPHHHRCHSSTTLVSFSFAGNINQSFYDSSHASPTDLIVCSPAMENQGWLKQKINTVNRYRNRGAHTDSNLSSRRCYHCCCCNLDQSK